MTNVTRRTLNQIPSDLLDNEVLKNDIELLLPSNYNFEIYRTIARIRLLNAKKIVLQMPEGLVIFYKALTIILEKHCYPDECVYVDLLEDPSYGACCIDDVAANKIGSDLLIHYGHSCLIPIEKRNIFYVLVDIKFDVKHFIDTVYANFAPGTNIVMVATVQFISTLQSLKTELSKTYNITIPKIAPLSHGEVLGCTAPKIEDNDVECILFLGDGRFHLESMMIANPRLPAYQYSPMGKTITHEKYDHDQMRQNRLEAINKAKSAKKIGLIHGTLGRQGSIKVLQKFIDLIENKGLKYQIIPMSEVFPSSLIEFADCDAFIQNSCPRLSIDWGKEFNKPFLNPYEGAVMLGVAEWLPGERYPSDFYAYESLGDWTPNFKPVEERRVNRRERKHLVVGGAKLPEQLKQITLDDNTQKYNICKEHEWTNCTNCQCTLNGN